jgi:hypothetical protein
MHRSPIRSVRKALQWNRAESIKLDGKPHDFDGRPTSPTLRRLAQHEMTAVKARKMLLDRLVEAVPLIEFSEEHCASMRERLFKLTHGTRAAALLEDDKGLSKSKVLDDLGTHGDAHRNGETY